MAIVAYGQTDIGRQRTHNEDTMLIDQEAGIYIVCDGVGGHAAGEVASQMAARVVQEFLQQHRDTMQAYQQQPSREQRPQMLRLVEAAIQEACAQVYALAQEDPTTRGMSTTIAMLLTLGEEAIIGHVGDSRVYVIREQHAHRLTEDHRLLLEQVKAGRLTPQDAERSPFNNVITRSVGRQRSVQVDTLLIELMVGDLFIICTDGLHDYIRKDDELATLSMHYTPNDLPTACIKMANQRGGKDNITVVLVEVTSTETQDDGANITVARKVEALKRLPLFKYFTYQELVKALNIVGVRSYQPYEIIVEEGEEGEDFFILLLGKVEVLKSGKLLRVLGPGDHFGEMALIDRAPRSAAIKAMESTRVMFISRKHFYSMLKQEPHMAVKLLWGFLRALNMRLRDTNTELMEARGELFTLHRDLSLPSLEDDNLPWVENT